MTGIAALPTGTSSRARLPDRTGADAGLRGCSAERNRHFPSSASLAFGLALLQATWPRGLVNWRLARLVIAGGAVGSLLGTKANALLSSKNRPRA